MWHHSNDPALRRRIFGMRPCGDSPEARHPRWWCVVVCLLLGCNAHADPPVATPPTRAHPNVVLIVVDTLRADRLTAKHGDIPVMPKLRRIAQQGWWFKNALAHAPWTKPSVVSILTGLYPKTHGVIGSMKLSLKANEEAPPFEGPPPGLEAAGEYFKRNGYATMAVQTNRLLRAVDGYARGFDQYIEAKDADAEPVNATLYRAAGKLSTPFFLYVHYMDPHSPYNPPEPHRSAFGALPALSLSDAEIFKEASTFNSYYMDRMLHDFGQKPQRDFAMLGESGRAYTRALYDGDCHYVDAQMARLLENILKQWPNTIFVVTADHGEELWDHGDVGHGKTLYQELVHVPLVVLAPNTEAREVDTRVESIDILPTIAALAGLQGNPAWQGRNLAQEDLSARPVFSETDGSFVEAGLSLQAVIEGDKKLIRDRNGTAQLFDIHADPREQHNLIESAPAVKARLLDLLDEHNMACLAHPLAKQSPTRTALDPDMVEKLRALGYADSPK